MPDVAPLSEVSVVIPCFNENHQVLSKLEQELQDLGAEVVIVDDGSKTPYPTFVWHPVNQGYGQSVMTGIDWASRSVIITMDGDGQHRAQDAVNLVQVWRMLDVDMIIGARRLNYEKPIRMWGRKILNFIASLFTGIYMCDLNSGMRIFKKKIAVGYFPILCRTFSFTTSITMSYMCDNYKVEWFPIKVLQRPCGKSHVKLVKDGLITLYFILRIGIALRTRRIRAWLRRLKST